MNKYSFDYRPTHQELVESQDMGNHGKLILSFIGILVLSYAALFV